MIAFAVVAEFAGTWLGEASRRRVGDLLAVGCMLVLAAMPASRRELPRVPEGAATCDVRAHIGAMIAAFTIVATCLLWRPDRRRPLAADMASLLLDTGGFLTRAVGGWFGGCLVYDHGLGGDRTSRRTSFARHDE